MNRGAVPRRAVLSGLWLLAACGSGAGPAMAPSGSAPAPAVKAETAMLDAVADGIAAWREALPRERSSMVALGPAADSLRARWRATLEATDARSLGADQAALRLVLLELLDQADAMAACGGAEMGVPNPVGADCYRGWVRLFTSLPLSPSEVYDTGVEMRLALEQEIAPLARAALGVDNSVGARHKLVADPRFRFASRAAMEEGSRRYLAQARAALPRMVRVVPDDSLELVIVPDEQARNVAAAAYYNPPRDGHPARFFLNSLQADERPRATAATAAFHEGWPGHHFQFARHAGMAPLHPALANLFWGAYVEGWGLYSERLADEIGLYDSPEDRIGYLLHMQDAMVALQVDAGLHAFGWSREQAVDTMMLVGGRPRNQAEQYADRHLAAPGQMVTYILGYREILKLRAEAERRLGAAFDVRDFHEAILAHGPVPLLLLRAHTRRWIDERARAADGQGGTDDQWGAGTR